MSYVRRLQTHIRLPEVGTNCCECGYANMQTMMKRTPAHIPMNEDSHKEQSAA